MLPIAIIAGGLGTRLRPLTETVPKSLVPVFGRPFVDHQLALLQSQGAERIVICAGFLGEMIEEHVGNGSAYGLDVAYSYDGTKRLGTAGALKKALPLLGESFLAIYGDSYLLCDPHAVIDAFINSERESLMTVYHNDGALIPSNVLFDHGRVVAYEKHHPTAQMQHVDFGLSAYHSTCFDRVPETEETDLSAIVGQLLARDQLAGFEVSTRFYEVGTLEGIAATEAVLRSRLVSDGS